MTRESSSPKSCARVARQLEAWPSLDERARRRLARHAESCPPCAEELMGLRAVESALDGAVPAYRSLRYPGPAPRLGRAPRAAPRWRAWRPQLAAGLVAIIVAVGLSMLGRSRLPPTPPLGIDSAPEMAAPSPRPTASDGSRTEAPRVSTPPEKATPTAMPTPPSLAAAPSVAPTVVRDALRTARQQILGHGRRLEAPRRPAGLSLRMPKRPGATTGGEGQP